MTHKIIVLSEAELDACGRADDETSFGALGTASGFLPLQAMDVGVRIDGLIARTTVSQTFVNTIGEPLEATYIFPLPARAAVRTFRMKVAGRIVEGKLEERAAARKAYEDALEAGHRAAIAEEERPSVFTIRVGNIPPGERAVVELVLVGPLAFVDGEATFRFPLVVAPRYIPGMPLPGASVGDGVVPDTDAVPDASRVTPPVLLEGYPNPVRLALAAELNPAGLAIETVRSSLHAIVAEEGADGFRKFTIQPGERLNRDFILRFSVAREGITSSLMCQPEATAAGSGDATAAAGAGDAPERGTFMLTIVPPAESDLAATRPRAVAFLLDRSGSMEGWKIVAARRAMARMIDTLSDRDLFTVLAFSDIIEQPRCCKEGQLIAGNDRQRFSAIEFLASLSAWGGTEMAEPLRRAVESLAAQPAGIERILVLVTDGQIGNEDQILRTIGPRLASMRVFTLGIDQAVNEGFLTRLASAGGGFTEFVETEDRLDEVLERVHRRIAAPLLTELRLEPDLGGLSIEPGTVTPSRLPSLFAGAPLLIFGRYTGTPSAMTVCATDRGGAAWSVSIPAVRAEPVAPIAELWARGRVRDLEDAYAAATGDRSEIEREIVATSLRHSVLCRFTAFVAIDTSQVVNESGRVQLIAQPVEQPAGWDMFKGAAAPMASLTETRHCYVAYDAGLDEVDEVIADIDEEREAMGACERFAADRDHGTCFIMDPLPGSVADLALAFSECGAIAAKEGPSEANSHLGSIAKTIAKLIKLLRAAHSHEDAIERLKELLKLVKVHLEELACGRGLKETAEFCARTEEKLRAWVWDLKTGAALLAPRERPRDFWK